MHKLLLLRNVQCNNRQNYMDKLSQVVGLGKNVYMVNEYNFQPWLTKQTKEYIFFLTEENSF